MTAKSSILLWGTNLLESYKFGHWYDMITMEKLIGEHPEYTQPDVIPYFELRDEVWERVNVQR